MYSTGTLANRNRNLLAIMTLSQMTTLDYPDKQAKHTHLFHKTNLNAEHNRAAVLICQVQAVLLNFLATSYITKQVGSGITWHPERHSVCRTAHSQQAHHAGKAGPLQAPLSAVPIVWTHCLLHVLPSRSNRAQIIHTGTAFHS